MMVSSEYEKSKEVDASTKQKLPEESDTILTEVRTRFRRSPYRELHEVVCDFHEGVLTLRGNVPSCFLKQIAQSTVFSIERILTIDNRLEVAETRTVDGGEPSYTQPKPSTNDPQTTNGIPLKGKSNI